MPNRHLILAANAIVAVHTAWLLAMLSGPLWAPWWLLAGAGAFVALLNLGYGKCPVTALEFSLRRRATRWICPRRLDAKVDWTGWRIVERNDATVVAVKCIPSKSMIGRLMSIPAHLCGSDWYPDERAVGYVTKVMLVLLPLAAWLREAL